MQLAGVRRADRIPFSAVTGRVAPSAAILIAVLAWPLTASGQVADPTAAPSPFSRSAIARSVAKDAGVSFDEAARSIDKRRACDGCPVRRLLRPYLESLAINVMYNGGPT